MPIRVPFTTPRRPCARRVHAVLCLSPLLLGACGGGSLSVSTGSAPQAGAPAASSATGVQNPGTTTPADSAGSNGGSTGGTDSGTTDGGSTSTLLSATASTAVNAAPRQMEKLGRGVVAVPSSSKKVLVSWRLLALDPASMAFNVYRSANGGTPVLLNSSPVTASTNFMDTTVDISVPNVYTVRPVLNGTELGASASNTLAANATVEPVLRVKLGPAPAPGYRIKYVWVGDLDGDAEFDFVMDRHAPASDIPDTGAGHQFLEAYKQDGTKLWRIDMGPLSLGVDNIYPGAATLGTGMLDGATVADLDGDGKAEVILKIADGTTFADGTVFRETNPELQHLAIIEGATGRLKASTPFPKDFLATVGKLATQLGVGSSDSLRPSVYLWGRNRNPNRSFNDVFANYTWDGSSTVTTQWTLPRPASLGNGAEASHQMRLIDVDGDGKDEFATGNFMLNSTGTWRYVMPGIGHGDRFFIGKFSKTTTGMDGFGVQQNNADLVTEYYYNATTGARVWTHFNPAGSGVEDIGRGMAADIDPRFPGYETWSFKGVHNGPTGTRTEASDNKPWPAHTLWWDADVLAENLSGPRMEKWQYETGGLSRVLTLGKFGAHLYGENPMFYGDILGDWRTEIITTAGTDDEELLIFTTNIETDKRFYTMAQNPAYRNHMTIKGYMQSPTLDYYFGDGMDPPPVPNIHYAGSGRLQAEAARLSGGTVAAAVRAGYAGTGYADFPATGGVVEFAGIDGGAAGGSKTVTVRFANGDSAPRTAVLRVNGVAQAVSFPSTGGWTSWATAGITVALKGGQTNTLRFESSGAGMANLDEILVPVPLDR